MPDMYHIDLIQPRTHFIGAADYCDVKGIPLVGGHGGHHHHSRAGRGYYQGGPLPLLYTVEYGDVKEQKDCIPDQVAGAVSLPTVKNKGDTMKPGDVLRRGEALRTKNGGVLLMQDQGNLVLYAPGPKGYTALWWTANHSTPATKAVMLKDGNFYLEDDQGNRYYSANSQGAVKLVFQTDGNAVWYDRNGKAIAYTVTGNWHMNPTLSPKDGGFLQKVGHAVGSLAGDAAHAMNSVANVAGKAIDKAGQVVSHIPVIGKPLKAVIDLNPVKAAGGLVSKIASGERLDHAFLETAKSQIHAIREVAPYAKMVASFVPGVGTGVAAALAAGTALADGRSITDAVIEGVKDAVPGGALGKSLVQAAVDITHGDSITDAAMHAALSNLPAHIQQAAQSAIALAKGKGVREAVLQAVRANLPPEAQKALEIGTAIGVARNIQSSVARELVKPAVVNKLVAAVKIPKVLEPHTPKTAAGAKGYKAAIALASHSGVTPTALAAARSGMTKEEQGGFDHGLKSYLNVIASADLSSHVRGGVVTRGKWRDAKPGEKGVPGCLVKAGRVQYGSFIRDSV